LIGVADEAKRNALRCIRTARISLIYQSLFLNSAASFFGATFHQVVVIARMKRSANVFARREATKQSSNALAGGNSADRPRALQVCLARFARGWIVSLRSQ
jgi:hypothetical protein